MSKPNGPRMGGGPRVGGGPGMHGGMHPGEKAKDFKGTISKLGTYLGRYGIAIFVVILFAIGSTVFSIMGPTILGDATTEIFTGLVGKINGGSGIDFDVIKRILLTLVGLYLASAACSFVQGYIMTNVSQKVTYRMRKEISEKMHVLPMKYYESKTTGEILSRITNDIDTLSQSLNQSITQLITSVATIIGVFVMMIRISGLMTLATVLVVPISLVLISFVIKKSQMHFKNQQEFLGHVNGQVEEVYGGHNIVQVFNKEKDMIAQFNEMNGKLYESAWKAQFLSGLMMPVMSFVSNLSYVAVAILGGYLVIQGKIQVGQIQSFIQYARNFTQPITQLSQVMNMFQQTAAAAERVFEFLGEEEEVQTAEIPVSEETMEGNVANLDYEEVQSVEHSVSDEVLVTEPPTSDKVEGNVEFDHVCFGYDPNKIVIKDFSAKVKNGQKIAIVGPTGAGKSTMVKLLMRFYDVNSGAIKIDGHNIKAFDRADLRELFGMVLQDTWLFNGTIMENIRYGRLDATDEEVKAAARAAHVDGFIRALPNGYNMELNEEASNVSQGQKQLLTIARAILSDPKILILDEATSSVDTRTEILIQKAMDNLMEGRTSFIIAHRLSTIKNADLILFMKDGDIVEQGTHDELLALGGYYANLYNSQFDKSA